MTQGKALTAGSAVAVAPPHPVQAGSVGVLGGTFDPIHIGHLTIAEEVREALGLERVIFVPTGLPPHKPDVRISPAADRAAMVELAIAGNPAFTMSRIELDRPGPSYTVDTIEALAAEMPAAGAGAEAGDPPGAGTVAGGSHAELTFILSAEAYAGLASWRRPDRILELCRMAVVPRAGASAPDPVAMGRLVPGAQHRTIVLGGPSLAIAGSTIRARVAAGRSIRYYVPDAVARYIGDHGLYAAPSTTRNHRP